MTPINLGDRPTNAPLPVHSVQRNLAAALGQLAFPAAGTVLGSTSPMRIAVTPPRRCYWICEAALIQGAPAGTWARQDWSLTLTPSDLNGRNTVQCANGLEHGGNYMTDTAGTAWFLEANTAYTCQMVSAIAAAGGFYYMQEVHTYLFGYTIGDGVY